VLVYMNEISKLHFCFGIRPINFAGMFWNIHNRLSSTCLVSVMIW
jgi:hypothetical protein